MLQTFDQSLGHLHFEIKPITLTTNRILSSLDSVSKTSFLPSYQGPLVDRVHGVRRLTPVSEVLR